MTRNTTGFDARVKQKFTSQFTGITNDVRTILIKAGNLKLDATDKELFEFVDEVFDPQSSLNENYQLRHQRAKLAIDKAVSSGMLKPHEKDSWIKLATSSFNTAMEVIKSKKENETELHELLKFSGHQLYMNGKLERLKELSEPYFKLKYSELQNRKYAGIVDSQNVESRQETKLSELEKLMKLSAKELYMQGLLERLKELDVEKFKLKYKEFFNVEYPF